MHPTASTSRLCSLCHKPGFPSDLQTCQLGARQAEIGASRLRLATGNGRIRHISTTVMQAHCQAVPLPGLQMQATQNTLMFRAVEAAFSIKPLFDLAARQARKKIAKRGRDIGVDIDACVADLRHATDWDQLVKEVKDPGLEMPAYFTQPFHAYPLGNLCWDAALEVEAAAAAVHAPVMDSEHKVMDPQGDANLRAGYSANLLHMLPQNVGPVKQIVDVGCSTGLSCLELLRSFPGSHVTGVDLSPHFLAVGRHLHKHQMGLSFVHAAGERTGLPAGSADLVSISLVLHELPQHATRAVIREAYRVLRPQGVLSVMEMDPTSASFQRLFANPFALAAFGSTEPWLLEYMSLDLPKELNEAGFHLVGSAPNTPRHKTVVAQKPK